MTDDIDGGPGIEPEPGQRFALVPEWLIDAGVSARALRVYVGLSIYWSNWSTGECWPRRHVIADRLGVSVDTVDRAVTELVGLGALRVEERRRDDGSRASNKLWIQRATPATRPADQPPGGRTSAGTPSAASRGHEQDPSEPLILPAPVPRDSLADRPSTPGDQAVDDVYDQALGVLTDAIDWAEAVDGDARPQLRRQVVASVAVAIARRPHDNAAAIAALVATHVDGPDSDTVDTTWPHSVDPRPTMHAWSTALQTCAHPPVSSAP